MKRSYIVLFVFLIYARLGFSQIPSDPEPWHKGTIILHDGTALEGLMQYIPAKGIVSFRTDANDPDQKTLYALNIATMTYHDDDGVGEKKFYSMAFPDKAGYEEVAFYEVLKEFQDFAVLSKKDQIKTQVSSMQNSYSISKKYFSSKLTLIQGEEFYFLSKEGEFEKYLTLLYKKVKAGVYGYRKEDTEFIDNNLFPKYLSTHWPAVKKYLHDNHIKLDRKEGIIEALNYYEKLLQ